MIHQVYTVSQKVVHQTHGDNFVGSIIRVLLEIYKTYQ